MPSTAEDLAVRAGWLASEFSLLGLGAGLVLSATLAAAVQGQMALAVGREVAWLGGGLAALGTAVVVVGRQRDAGGCRRRSPGLEQTWLPVTLCGAWTAIGATATAMLPWPRTGGLPPVASAAGVVLTATALLGAVPVLAGLGLRSLAALGNAAASPLTLLGQAVAHTLLAGAALLTVLAAAADHLGLEGRLTLAAAVATLGTHALLLAGWLLRDSRRLLRQVRAAGLRAPLLERGHLLASAATVLGLALPSLAVVHDVVSGRETAMLLACGWMAAANHVMRYAWIVLGGLRRPRAAPQ